jgi:AcrR family transcriptional regulator
VTDTAETRIFEAPQALPRGPHGLTREEVAESQRLRLLAAFTELLAEGGYAAVTIGELARRAGVSRAAFYEHFAGKEACLLAAYDRFAVEVARAIAVPIDDEAPWGAFVDAALGGFLELLEREPTAARAFFVEMDAAGPAARRRRHVAMQGFAALLAERHAVIRTRDASLAPLPRRVYLAVALGVRELVHDALESDPVPPLTDLGPDAKVLLTAVIEGAGAAQRAA